MPSISCRCAPARTVWNTTRYLWTLSWTGVSYQLNNNNSYCHSLVLWILSRMCNGSHVLLHNSWLHFYTGLEGSGWRLHRIIISPFYVWLRILDVVITAWICLGFFYCFSFIFLLARYAALAFTQNHSSQNSQENDLPTLTITPSMTLTHGLVISFSWFDFVTWKLLH